MRITRFRLTMALLLVAFATFWVLVTSWGGRGVTVVAPDTERPDWQAKVQEPRSAAERAARRQVDQRHRVADPGLQEEADQDHLSRVTGRLLWNLGRPVADAPYCFRPAEDRDPFALSAIFDKTSSLRRTSNEGEWGADAAEFSGTRLWFKIGPGLFASFVVKGTARSGVELEVEKCSIRASVMGLGTEECSFATQPRVQHPKTKEWSYEDYLYVESSSESASPVLYLVTQFLEGRKGDGDVFIPVVRGVNYAVSCGSGSREVVKDEVFVEAPGYCEFVFKPRARNLIVEIVDTTGYRLKDISGYRSFAEWGGSSDTLEFFEGGAFRAVESSVLYKSSDPALSLLVALSDGELFFRRVPRKDWAQGVIKLVKGTGDPGMAFNLPLEKAPNKGKIVINTSVWAYAGGKRVEGWSAKVFAFPQSKERFYFLVKGDSLLVMGLNDAWTDIWFQCETGDIARVRRGGNGFHWVPTYLLKNFNWGITHQYRGGSCFRVRVDYRFSAGSKWLPTQSWDLTKTPAPKIRLLKGVPFRIVVNHGNGRLQTVILQG